MIKHNPFRHLYSMLCIMLLTFPVLGVIGQTYSFTNAGASGISGPSQTQVNSAYTSTTLAGKVTITGSGIQQWVVPANGTYSITAAGAQGGSTPSATGGRGRIIVTQLNLTAGTVLNILVGQRGGYAEFAAPGYVGGGGGGSFVINQTTNTPILISGGGGGAAQGNASWGSPVLNGIDAPEYNITSGANGIGYAQSWSQAGLGGVNGGGGTRPGSGGAGGGGYTGNGAGGGSYAGDPGISYLNGGLGGVNRDYFGGETVNTPGGFGGGGGAATHSNYEANAGGGGGYSGGGGGNTRVGAGGGGGNLYTGTFVSSSLNTGNGFVTITNLLTPAGALNFVKSTPLSGNYISVPHSSSLNLGSDFTIEAWVNYTGTDNTIIDKGDYDYLLQINCSNPGFAPNKIDFYNRNTGAWVHSTGTLSPGVWNHVAITLTGGVMTFYINGVASGTANVTYTQDNGPVNIGRQNPINCLCNTFNGSMDELRIWNRALPACEIASTKDCELSAAGATGIAAYYKFNQGNVGSDNTSITTLTDASANNNTGTLVGFTKTGNTSNFVAGQIGGTCSVFTTPAISAGSNSPVNAGGSINLTASGTNVTTYSWAGPNSFTSSTQNPTISTASAANAGTYTVTGTNGISSCTVTATTSVSINAPATALNFDGANDFINVPANAAFNTVNYTAECWINPKSVGINFQHILGKRTSTTGWNIFLTGANIVLWNGYGQVITGPTVPVNTWTHIAVTGDASGQKLYINGLPVGSTNAVVNPATLQNFRVGLTSDDNSWPFGGSIDEVRFWNRALCQSEIQNNMNCNLAAAGQTGLVALYHLDNGFVNGTNTGIANITVASDASGNGFNGTLTNFGLTGASSNYVAGNTSGTCSVFTTTNFPVTGSTTICVSATTQLANANSGTWSSSNTAIATINASGLVTGISAGTVTITFTSTCGSVSTASVTVNALPNAGIIKTDVSCAGNNDGSITVTATGGSLPYQYSSNGGATYQSANIFSGLAPGTYSIVVKAASGCATTAQSITIINTPDVTLPVVSTQPVTVSLDANGAATITEAQVDNGSSDNCGIASIVVSKTNFSCADFGPNTVTLTVTDKSGNVSTGTAVVTVIDNILPSITAPANVTAVANSSCVAPNVTLGTPVTSDNCGILSVTNDAPAQFPVGTTTVTWTVTDTYNNINTATQTVTVSYQPNTVSFNTLLSDTDIKNEGALVSANNLGANAAPVQINGVCFSNSPANLTNFANGGGAFCADCVPGSLLQQLLNALVFQPNGNLSTLTIGGLTPCHRYRLQLLYSNDVNSTGNNINITVNGQTYHFANWIPAAKNLIVEFTATSTSTVVSFLANDGAEPNRAVLNAYAVHDLDLPNSAPCNSAPVANAGSDISVNAGSNCSGTVTLDGSATTDADGLNTLSYTWKEGSTILGTGVTLSKSFSLGTHTVSLTVKDNWGILSTDIVVITVSDVTPPSIVCPGDMSVIASSAAGAVVTYATPVGTDNCSGVTTVLTSGLASGATFPIGTTHVTYTVTDGAGLTASCSFAVTVSGLAPVIVSPGNITVNNDPGQCSAVVTYEATESTGVPASTISYSIPSGGTFALGTTTVTAIASNAVGSSTCSFTVTVKDVTPPTIVCAANITVNANANNCNANVVVPKPTVSDNCGGSYPAAPFASNNSNLMLWMDATRYNVANGANMNGILSDISGYNRSLTTNATFETSSINGRPAVRYNNNRTIVNAPFSTNGNSFIYLAVQVVAAGTQWASILDHHSRDMGLALEQSGFKSSNVYHFQTGNDNANVEQSLTFGTNYIMACSIIGGNLRSFTLYKDNNGVLQNLGTSTNNTFNVQIGNNHLYIGKSDANEYANMKLGEFIYFQNSLPVSESNVVNYLYNKWFGNQISVTNSFNGTSDASGIYPVGNTNVIWTAIDAAGNSSTCAQKVTVIDATPPSIVCPGDMSVFASSAAGAVVTYATPVGTDNCSGVTTELTEGLASGSTFGIGTTKVTYTATDAAGLTASCSFNVTVSGLKPVIVAPQNISVSNDAGKCGAMVSYAATDNTGIPASVITYSIQPNSFFPIGSTDVVATATNAVGTSVATFTVTVTDDELPIVITKPITIQLNATGKASITVADVDNGSKDNCGITSYSLDKTTFDCSNVGPNTVTLTVTDIHNNVSTGTAIVTVEDKIAPIVITKNITIQLDANGNASITPAMVDGGSSDNCGIATMSISQSSFTCADITGAVSTNTQTIVSDDTWAESSTTYSTGNYCQTQVWNGVSSPMPTVGSYSIAPTMYAYSVTPIPGTMGMYGLNGVRFFRKTFNLSSVSGIKATLLAAMDNGVQIFINGVAVAYQGDMANSNFNGLVPDRVVLNSTGANVNGGVGYHSYDNITNTNASSLFVVGTNEIVLALANCDGGDRGAITFKAIIETNSGGAGSVVLTVTDVNGNTASANAQVTVVDNIKPVITSNGDQSVNNDLGKCGAQVSVSASATDNCGVGVPTGVRSDNKALTAEYPVGTTTITWTVTDNNGNAALPVTQTIIVTDNTIPVITTNGDKSVSNDAGKCGAAVVVSASAADNCGVGAPSGVRSDNKPLSDPYPVGTTTITWTVTDVHGNNAVPVTQTIEVTDNEKPVITSNGNKSVNNDPGKCGATLVVSATAADNCSVGAPSGLRSDALALTDLYPVGTTTISWTVTDIHGNIGVPVTQTIVVTDNEKPVIACAPDVVFCANYGGVTTYTINALTAGDNCGILSTTYAVTGATTRSGSGNNASGVFAVGVSTITWTVTDTHGNVSVCSTKVTINPLPVASFVSSNADAFCNKTTLTASSNINPATYSWTSGSTPGSFIANADLVLGLTNADGIYKVFVKATNTGCISEFAASYNYQKQNLAGNYTILAYKEVELGKYNKVQTGSVGVMTAKGEAEFNAYTSVNGPGAFVKSPKIDKDGSGIVIPTQIIGLANVTLPTMQYNTATTNNLPSYTASVNNATLTGSYKNLTVKKGVSVTVTASTFGSIRLEEGASIRFTSSVLNIDNLSADRGAKNNDYSYIRFAPNTSVRMSGYVSFGSQVLVNPEANKVTFYMGDLRNDEEKFTVKGGDTKVIANIIMPDGKLRVTATDCDDDNHDSCDHKAHDARNCKHRGHDHNDCDHRAHTAASCNDDVYMTGLFIAEEVESKGNTVIWNSYDCSSPVPSYSVNAAATATNATVESKEAGVTTEEELKITVMPNPSTTYFTLKLESKYATPVNMRVMDGRGRVIDAKSQIGSNSTIQIGHNYSSGTYYAELIQGTQRKVVQLIKARG